MSRIGCKTDQVPFRRFSSKVRPGDRDEGNVYERQYPALVLCLFLLHQHPEGGNLAFLFTWCGVLPTDADNLMRNEADLHPWNEVLRTEGTRGVSEEKGRCFIAQTLSSPGTSFRP